MYEEDREKVLSLILFDKGPGRGKQKSMGQAELSRRIGKSY